MGRTLAQVVPLALAATISPTGLLLILSILSSGDKPRRKSIFFLLGSLLFLIMAGIVVMLFFQPLAGAFSEPARVSGAVDIVLALLILLIVGRTALKRRQPQPARVLRQRPRPYFALGFFYMFQNASTLIPFIAACKIIGEDGEPLWSSMLSFTVVVLVTMLMVSTPVIIACVAPKKSALALDPLKVFMKQHSDIIIQVVLAIFAAAAVYLLIHGLTSILLSS